MLLLRDEPIWGFMGMTNKTTMRKIIFFTLCLFASSLVVAQNINSVSSFFNAKIDSLVANAVFSEYDDDEPISSNPVYLKLMTTPVVYSSVINKGLTQGFSYSPGLGNHALAADEKRSSVIDATLLSVYKEYPGKVRMTEEQLRGEVAAPQAEKVEEVSVLNFSEAPVLEMPDNVTGDLQTTVNKPNYWRTSGSFDLKFTQNYVSSNWSQGGENSRTLLAILVLKLNYDDKKKITFTNRFEANLGFTTVQDDEYHSYKTNNDRLRLESNLGYKLVDKLDVTIKSNLQTQMLPNYPSNSRDFVSKFMAPFDATFSLGFNYKPTWKNLSLEVFLAPLSAYNYKFVRYRDLATRYGIRPTRHHKEDFGTQLVVTVPTATFFKILNWWSRAEFYTNYERSYLSWENKFDIKLNRYFSVSMLIHTRFDDSSPSMKDCNHGYWQYKEYMTMGLSYSW